MLVSAVEYIGYLSARLAELMDDFGLGSVAQTALG